MDVSVIAKECEMSNTTRYRLNTVSKGVFLVALLASAGALAATPTAPVNDASWQLAAAPAARPEVADPDQILPRRTAAGAAARQSTQAPTARVYLEDFERVHRQVNRQYPTKIYWIGKSPQAK
jgi:hypothetical protein